MSAIIACTGPSAAAPLLLDGLRRHTPHDHDSAGIAVLSRRRLRVWKTLGSITALAHRVPERTIGNTGIAHTRVATHGEPSEINAHPHLDAAERLAIVHNGIIENADSLRRRLRANGRQFQSATDSEVLVALLAHYLEDEQRSLEHALDEVLTDINGTCGLAVLDRQRPDTVVVARIGSPLFLGLGAEASFAGSDASALRAWAQESVSIGDGERATLTPGGIEVVAIGTGSGHDRRASRQEPPPSLGVDDTASTTTKVPGQALHSEIVDQPAAIARVLAGRLDRRFASVRLGGLNLEPTRLRDVKRLHLLGCGSAWHAAQSGARMIESLARLPTQAESAGEFRYRDPIIEADTLYIIASRSGETFDSLAALREIRLRGGTVLGVVNDVGSTIAREVHGGVYLHAGSERSIVATKTVSAMLVVFALFAILLGRHRDVSPQRGTRLLEQLDALPTAIEAVIADEATIMRVARALLDADSVLFTGRAAGHAIALEGARKLSEASGIHTTAYPAAELAHGPIALLDARTPCVVLLPEPDMLPLSLSSLEHIKARGAPLVVVGNSDEPRVAELADHIIHLPQSAPLLQPIIAGVALQLLAYHSGVALGRDVDRPESLAERVIVE